MAQVMNGAPWWRIVGKDGRLPISKRSPEHSREQRERLAAEGVEFEADGAIKRRFFVAEAAALTLFPAEEAVAEVSSAHFPKTTR